MRSRSHKFATLFVIVVWLAISALTVIAQKGWVPSGIAPPNKALNTVYFVDGKRGWIAGDGGFMSRTDDAGTTWAQQTVGSKDAINDIYFRSKEDGFLLAGNTIFVSHDSGSRWE